MLSYFRCAPDISLETSSNTIPVVRLGKDPVDLTPVQVCIVDILLRMPDASLDEILTGLVVMTGNAHSAKSVAPLLEELGRLQVVQMHACEPRLKMPYPISHTCEMCGCSCMAQLVGPLTDDEHSNVLEAHKNLDDIPKDVNPIMKGLKPDGTCLHFLNFPGKRCFFLDENNRCRIHGHFGAMKKPAACRRFPVIAIATESEIRIGIKPYCYANMRVCCMKPCSGDEISQLKADDAMKDVLDDLISNASFRPVLRIPDEDELLQGRIQESQILTWLESDLSYASLLASLARGTRTNLSTLPKPFLQDLQKTLRAIEPMFRAEAEKLGSTPHADHVRSLCDVMTKPLTNMNDLDAASPFGRYLRYALYEAVFLRETSRFPAVSLGTFGLAVGGLVAAQDIEHASDHLTAWMRLLAQTQAFAMLFPSPQAMGALMRHL